MLIENFYPDTSIWLDVYEKRGKNGELSLRLFSKIIKENLHIHYSDLNVKELKNLGYASEISKIFDVFKLNLRKVHIYKKQIDEANKISKAKNVPRKDVLQAILCRDNFLQLISRDRHFERLRDITIAKLPEDFI